MTRYPFRRRAVTFTILTAVTTATLTFLVPTAIQASVIIRPRAAEVHTAIDRSTLVQLPFAAGHVAVHWAGNPEATVAISLSSDGNTFGPPTDVGRDEVGEHRGDGETYSAILQGQGATWARVTSDRPIGRLSVLALGDGERVVEESRVPASAGGAVPQPSIVSRSQWGADESLRFRGKREVWPPTFHTIQKLIVHHTATQNADPDPAATMRSIYYYHAVTQRWGDIGYNFLIDEAGTIYKGRHSHTTVKTSVNANDDTLNGENASGQGVTAGHSYGFNAGTVGVALLGTLSVDPPTAAAESALERVLAWKAGKHGIDPQGESVYTNPLNGDQKLLANIAAHRDVSATECPGDVLYSMLPQIRADVALLIASSP
jgi:hypothetical protein